MLWIKTSSEYWNLKNKTAMKLIIEHQQQQPKNNGFLSVCLLLNVAHLNLHSHPHPSNLKTKVGWYNEWQHKSERVFKPFFSTQKCWQHISIKLAIHKKSFHQITFCWNKLLKNGGTFFLLLLSLFRVIIKIRVLFCFIRIILATKNGSNLNKRN